MKCKNAYMRHMIRYDNTYLKTLCEGNAKNREFALPG